MKVYKAINSVMQELCTTGIKKDRTNSQGAGFKFRGIDDVYNALAPLLSKCGLLILPRVLSRNCEERQSKSGSALFYVTVEVEFDFIGVEDGSKHTIKTFGEAMDSGDKATNKAMSAAYKYACLEAFCIPTERDNDADAHTHQVAAKPATKPVNWVSKIESAKNLDELKAVFGDAWKNTEGTVQAECKATYEAMKTKLQDEAMEAM